ncbi:MAG: hypothetical protein HOM55_00175 [Proteobacteria bacterium]|nr:hypothetical protein [Pseudomonadota bacterium]
MLIKTGGTILSRVIAVVMLATYCAVTSAQQEASDADVLNKALTELEASEFAEVLKTLEDLSEGSEYTAASLMVSGTALNRLGLHNTAAVVLRRADDLSYPGELLNFELGWAWLEVGENDLAIMRLTGFVRNNPEHAKGNELLGRALARSGQVEDGIGLMRNAESLDAELSDTVNLELATIAYAFGDSALAAAKLNNIVEQSPDSPIANYLRNTFAVTDQVPAGVAAAQPSNVTWWGVQSYAGYNDNVIGRGRNQPLPEDISGQGSSFVHFGGHLGHRKVLSNRSDIYAVASLGTDKKFDVSEVDNVVARGSARYRYRLDSGAVITAGANAETLRVDGEKIRDGWSVSTGVDYRLADDKNLEVYLARNEEDYDLGSLFEFRDRDGDYWTASARYGQEMSETLSLHGGVSLQSYSANGDDYDNDAWSLYVQAVQQADVEVAGRTYTPSVTAFFSYRDTNYDNLNSFAGTNGFAFARDDQELLVSVSVNVPIKENWTVFMQLQHADNQSNVDAFDYKQSMFNVGFSPQY